MNKPDHDVTQMLQLVANGDAQAINALMPMVYKELHTMAGRYMYKEYAGHTLQTTALLNEAYIKLIGQNNVDWQSRSHFFALGAQAMRRILVDHARSKKRAKRGGGQAVLELEEGLVASNDNSQEVLEISDAIDKLAELDERQAKIVELRYFGGLNVEEVAQALGVSKRTVEGDWTMAKAWLKQAMDPQ